MVYNLRIWPESKISWTEYQSSRLRRIRKIRNSSLKEEKLTRICDLVKRHIVNNSAVVDVNVGITKIHKWSQFVPIASPGFARTVRHGVRRAVHYVIFVVIAS
jgi:hypothetical protein